jgi:hypothetical protein
MGGYYGPATLDYFPQGFGGSNQFSGYLSQLGGANQLGGYPSMPTQQQTQPGIVPQAQSQAPTSWNTGIGGWTRIPGAYTGPTLAQGLTSEFAAYLQSMLGKGATPFNLSAILPSTGQTTTPGTLTAPENPLLQSLQQFYLTGQGGPMPGVLPMWTSAMQAMDIPIQQQLANIKEQFGARGALGSSEMAQALASFGEQTAAEQQALLGQLTLQALPGMQSTAGQVQQLDQASINNLLQEFIRTRPEYSPLLSQQGALAETFPPIYQQKGGGIAGLVGAGGDTAAAIAKIIAILAGL